ncbi:hypothetical protein J7E24_06890 [Hymenobacter sp. ISL-91]|uniref:hypothetical protein n=1 Tax=Hymenobacter sp. ISL-91 TaxID=2819151 RepID=UPI001BE77912|nr:hypothetical protein [Hymenobacter sp. ISL-91]MBT2557505.1 hypothetical protein [Hymenobacter sp. ISL-91]
MSIRNEYENQIGIEVETLAKNINKALLEDEYVKNLYHGWRVMFSPMFEKPDILIIGINPGNGQSGVEDWGFWSEDEIFEYTNPEYSFALARETKEVFERAGLSSILEKSTVKTNYYYLSTTKESDLYIITDHLANTGSSDDNLRKVFFDKSASWTKTFIDIVNPKLILCEGKSAYDNVTDLFPEYGECDWQNDCGYTIVPKEKIVIIGYSRRYSGIKNKEALTDLLVRFCKV